MPRAERVAAATAALLEGVTNRHADNIAAAWWELGEKMVAKYSNGYVTTAEGARDVPGYPADWLCRSNFFNFPHGNEGVSPCPIPLDEDGADASILSPARPATAVERPPGRLARLIRPRAFGPADA